MFYHQKNLHLNILLIAFNKHAPLCALTRVNEVYATAD